MPDPFNPAQGSNCNSALCAALVQFDLGLWRWDRIGAGSFDQAFKEFRVPASQHDHLNPEAIGTNAASGFAALLKIDCNHESFC